MQADIHPAYGPLTVTCSCGNTFETASALGQDSLHVEICSKCHPFYTGEQRLVDTEGRLETFNKRFAQFGKFSKKQGKAEATDS